MARHRRIVFDEIWVRVSQTSSYPCSHATHSRSSRNTEQNKQDEMFAFFFIPPFVVKTDVVFQVFSCKGTSTTGSHLRIHRRTTTLFGTYTMKEQQYGFWKVMYLKNGKQQGPCCGSTGNICLCNYVPASYVDDCLILLLFSAGAGKSTLV